MGALIHGPNDEHGSDTTIVIRRHEDKEILKVDEHLGCKSLGLSNYALESGG
jgi:hypothetical protein